MGEKVSENGARTHISQSRRAFIWGGAGMRTYGCILGCKFSVIHQHQIQIGLWAHCPSGPTGDISS